MERNIFQFVNYKKIQSNNKLDLKKELDKLEKEHIKQYNSLSCNNGYNLSVGGQASNTCQKQIDQYNIDGLYIKTWDSMTDVSDFYHITKASVSACCRGKSKSCAGYVWRFCGDSFDLYSNIQNVSVKQFSIEGKLLNIFLSMSDASRFMCGNDCGVTNISACCRGKSHTAYGYVWRYVDGNFDDYYIHRNKSKRFVHKVNCYSLNGEYICTYESVMDATQKLGLKSASSIQESCSNHHKHARNLLWYYADDPEQPDKTKIIN